MEDGQPKEHLERKLLSESGFINSHSRAYCVLCYRGLVDKDPHEYFEEETHKELDKILKYGNVSNIPSLSLLKSILDI